jgi:hypothetical protein
MGPQSHTKGMMKELINTTLMVPLLSSPSVMRQILTASEGGSESCHPEDGGDMFFRNVGFLIEPHDSISHKTTSFFVTSVKICHKTAFFDPKRGQIFVAYCP